MLRTYDFENGFSPDELAEALHGAGIPADMTLAQIVAGGARDVDADDEVSLSVTLDEDELVEKLTDEAIVRAYVDRGLVERQSQSIEDGFRYVRDGDLPMARAMFERVFDDADLDAAMRGLA